MRAEVHRGQLGGCGRGIAVVRGQNSDTGLRNVCDENGGDGSLRYTDISWRPFFKKYCKIAL